jgi:hypothetical protein
MIACALSPRSITGRLLAAVAVPEFFLIGYLIAVRPSQLRWGATREEVKRSMPGDDLVTDPTFCATRAITIRATPEEIWPWLIQMGYNRAGFYGYDLIENLGSSRGIRSARTILPEFQHPRTGDVLPISAVAHLVFGSIQPNQSLIWQSEAGPTDGAFTWSLYPLDSTHTRLVSRIRLLYHWSHPWLLTLDLFTEFADHLAVPKLLRGLRDHAEGRRQEPLIVEGLEVVVLIIAMIQFALATWAVFHNPSLGHVWLIAFVSGSVLLFVFYAHARPWIEAVLACGALAAAGQVLCRRSAPVA